MAAAVKDGSFRRDLYHRLNGFEIEVPPLRERPSDIPILAQHFFELLRHEAKRPLSGISPEAIECLRSASWPGNVRELKNRIQRAVAICRHDEIQSDDVRDSSHVDASGESSNEPLSLAEVEKRHIIAALRWTGGNVQQAAKILQIGRTTLYTKLAEYDIQP
jgi:DNA-binding NtrC family response regulator